MRTTRLVLFGALLVLALAGFFSSLPQGNLWDFSCFVLSARLLADGASPYPAGGSYSADLGAGWMGNLVPPNLNAPFSLLLFSPLAGIEPHLAFRAWYAMSFTCFVIALALLVWRCPTARSPVRIAWALSLGGLWHTLWLGNIYNALALLVAITWLLLSSRRMVLAGCLMGLLIAVKPNFAIWPALLLLSGNPLIAVVSGISAGLLSAATASVYGPQIYFQWLGASSAVQGGEWFANASLAGIAARAGLPLLGIALSVLAAAVLAFWVWRVRPTVADTSTLSLIALILLSPLGWLAYTVFLLPVLLPAQWTRTKLIAAAVFTVPFWALHAVYWDWGHPELVGLVYPFGLGAMLWAVVRERNAASSSEVANLDRLGIPGHNA